MSHYAANTLAVKLFQKALGFADWIQGLPGKITPPPWRLMQLGSLFWQSRVLYVAARLDIATAGFRIAQTIDTRSLWKPQLLQLT